MYKKEKWTKTGEWNRKINGRGKQNTAKMFRSEKIAALRLTCCASRGPERKYGFRRRIFANTYTGNSLPPFPPLVQKNVNYFFPLQGSPVSPGDVFVQLNSHNSLSRPDRPIIKTSNTVGPSSLKALAAKEDVSNASRVEGVIAADWERGRVK